MWSIQKSHKFEADTAMSSCKLIQILNLENSYTNFIALYR